MKKKWEEDNRVLVDFDGEDYPGAIVELTKTKAKVLFDDGEVHDIELKDLKSGPSPVSEEDEDFVSQGFSQYNIKWDKTNVNFAFKAEGGKFYGWWRQTRIEGGGMAYAIDLHVEYKDQKYSVETIGYLGKDPRDDIDSLNADICAAANKWFYSQCNGRFDTIHELKQKADKPTITIRRLETIDRIILRLKEYRDMAIRSGGFRIMTFTGDNEKTDPSGGMRIQMDLTSQAMGLKGKVPSLYNGTILDSVAEDSSKKAKGRGRPLELEPDQKNIDELLKQLQQEKDKSKQRKIRATLRRMGHRGGARTGGAK